MSNIKFDFNYDSSVTNISSKKTYDYKDSKYINTNLFSPLIYDAYLKPPKYNKKWEKWVGTGKRKKLVKINYPKYYTDYWAQVDKWCREGYSVGGITIPGTYFFWLNIWKINGKDVGVPFISPRFSDAQLFVFQSIEDARNEGENILGLKRRQMGFSEMVSCLTGYEMTFYPNSQTLIVSGLEDYANHTADLVRSSLSHLGKTSREYWKRRLNNTTSFTKLGFKDKDGVEHGYLSELYSITTMNNPAATVGKRPSRIFIEEMGKTKKLNTVISYALPSLEENGTQKGRNGGIGRQLVAFGTAAEMEDGTADAENCFYNPEQFNFRTFPPDWMSELEKEENKGKQYAMFIGADKYMIQDEWGNSLIKESREHILKERQKVENNPKILQEKKVQMPLTPEEAFEIPGFGPFPSHLLGQREKHLHQTGGDALLNYGRFDFISRDSEGFLSVEWTAGGRIDEDEFGDLKYPWVLIEHPDRPKDVKKYGEKFSDLYSSGLDDYAKDESESSDSEGSFVILKGVNPEDGINKPFNFFTARLTWRPKESKFKFYDQCLMAAIYYNCKILVEDSNQGFFDYCKNNPHKMNFEYLLYERPRISSAQLITETTVAKYGVTPSTKKFWIDKLASFLTENYDYLYDTFWIRRFRRYRNKDTNGRKYNCDITISSALSVLMQNDREYDEVKKVNTKSRLSELRSTVHMVDDRGNLISNYYLN